MITRKPINVQQQSWQSLLASAFSSTDDLLKYLEIDPESLIDIASDSHFPLRVPLPFARRMNKGDINDPLLHQVLTRKTEEISVAGFSHDPLQESNLSIPGMLHKYQGRVLLINNSACAVHCRYCFRRHYPYQDNRLNDNNWQRILHYIESDTSIEEVILSGGDPLMLNDHLLKQQFEAIEAIPHVIRIRIHTRFPVVIPQRITEDFVNLLSNTRLQVITVLHINHANELDALLIAQIQQLKAVPNITLLNQAVLLKGVNDSEQALIELHKKLFQTGIMPYYLHQLDKVSGSAHFEVTEKQSLSLMAALRSNLPGYMLPSLVKEQAHLPHKTPIV